MRPQLHKKLTARIASFLILLGVPVYAEDAAKDAQISPRYEFYTTLGYGRLAMNELVVDHLTGQRISHLRWEAEVPIVTFAAHYALSSEWIISGNLALGTNGDGRMTDYDWYGPFFKGTGYDEWTHRSQHPNTETQRYIDLELALGRDFPVSETTNINLHGGLKYTSITMDAYGGSQIRSVDGFRDKQIEFLDDQQIISYQQWHRTVFTGAELRHKQGDWQLSALLRAGVSIAPRDVDDHWGRELRFEERLEPAPFAQIGFGAKRPFENGLSLVAGVNYQKYFERRGDTQITDTDTGGTEIYTNGGAADMSVMTFNIGISRDF